MGIYAKGEQLPATRVSDTPQDRYGELADPNDIGGSALGQVIADSKATATSANDTAGAMANDLSALESRVDALEGMDTASGTGWLAYKRAGVVTVVIDGLTDSFNLPAGFRPPVIIYIPRATETTEISRIRIRPDGLVTRRGDLTSSFYGVATYLTTEL